MAATASARLHLPPMPTIQELIRTYKLGSKKKLSQNFLLDMNLTGKFVRSAGKDLRDHYVCEVGPGPGGITRSLLNAGVKNLSVIEVDRRFMPSLQILNDASGGRMRIFHGDVLRFNMEQLFPEELSQPWDGPEPNIHVIGNLPFSVSTPLIIKWLEAIKNRTQAWHFGRSKLTLTFQKEVAERMVAEMRDKQRSRLSIMCQHLCEVTHKFTIPGKAFVPEPEVDVAVVQFVPRVRPLIDHPFKVVEKVVRHVFHHRQKMCKRGIQTLFPSDRPEFTTEMVMAAEIDPSSRSYQLTIEEFGRLCDAYVDICNRNPGIYEYYFRTEENAILWRQNKVPLEI